MSAHPVGCPCCGGLQSGSPAWRRRIDDNVTRCGLHITFVPFPGEDPGDPEAQVFVYSVGRAGQGQPEFLTTQVFAVEAPLVAAVFNMLHARGQKGAPPVVGERFATPLPGGGSVMWAVAALPPEDLPEICETMVCQAIEYHGGPVALLRVEIAERLDGCAASAQGHA